MLWTIHLPWSGGASSPGQMYRAVTLPVGLLVCAGISSPASRGLLSAPGSPRYALARNLRKPPSSLSAFAMFKRLPG